MACCYWRGSAEIARYPDVLKALSPHYAYELIVRYPHGFWLLGSVFLCITGKTEGTHPFSTTPGDKFSGWDCSANLDWMPNQALTIRIEYVHHEANVPYFAGHGGVTSPTGYQTTPMSPGWAPDLVKSETRLILAILFRL